MALEKAMALAKEKELDLVEVAPMANPSVCKIMDYGKHQYQQKKVETKHRKSQKKTTVKGVRLGFKTGDHDLMIKVKQAKKFLASGNIVKVSLIFKGREIVYKDLAKGKLEKFSKALEDVATVEEMPKGQGHMLIMILNPIK